LSAAALRAAPYRQCVGCFNRADLASQHPQRKRPDDNEARHYMGVGKEFASHGAVNHKALEYARGQITTNTVEGFYSIFKRGMRGVYQHCAERHLHRYLSEFDLRYSNRVRLGVNDEARTNGVLKGIVGKRLTYRRADSQASA
jgi:hypothetical protein